MIEKKQYITKAYPFRELFCDLIAMKSVEYLHHFGGFENTGHTPGNDNNSEWHKWFYDHMRGSIFMQMYDLFMLNQIAPFFDEHIAYQKYPTLRIQIPGGKGVAAYHVDSEYNHPKDEINIWLPLTHAHDTASIYIESEPGKGDYTSQDVKYGEYLMFEGGKLSHGNEVNLTGKTRVSIDMRVIPLSKFVPSDKRGLAHGKVRDIVGEDAYYGVI